MLVTWSTENGCIWRYPRNVATKIIGIVDFYKGDPPKIGDIINVYFYASVDPTNNKQRRALIVSAATKYGPWIGLVSI